MPNSSDSTFMKDNLSLLLLKSTAESLALITASKINLVTYAIREKSSVLCFPCLSF